MAILALRSGLLMVMAMALLGLPTRGVAAGDFAGALAAYRAGEYPQSVKLLDDGANAGAREELLRGLAQLRLDEPGRAAQSWARFISLSQDESLVDEVSRMRTLLVREADRRAARAVLAGGRRPRLSADVIAILPLRNVGSAKYEPLGRAIGAVVAANLGAIPKAQIVESGRVEALLEALGDPGGEETKVAREIGRLAGAGIVIVGAHVDTPGDPPTIEIVSAMIATGTGSRFETGSFLAPLNRFYVSIRDTSVALATRLGWSPASLAPDVAARVGLVETESIEAMLDFGQGLALEEQGDFEAARAKYESALRADASFPLPRARLATLPAGSLSMAAVAAAIESELPLAPPPTAVVVADVPKKVSEPSEIAESGASPIPEREETQPAVVAKQAAIPETRTLVVEVASDGPEQAEALAQRDGEDPEAEEDGEETTILGMSPLTAGLVGVGAAAVIGGAAAGLAGGGGGGGGGGDGPVPVQPPVLRGVESRTVSAGDRIELDLEAQDPEGSTVELSQNGAPGAATFETTTGNPAAGTFRWQTTASDAGVNVDVTFTATAQRGPPNDTTSATAALRVLAVAPTPVPTPGCGTTGASCTSAAGCCQEIARECDVTPAGGEARCCLPIAASCQLETDCCGNDRTCREQRCCAPLGASCGLSDECCDAGAACEASRCCKPDGLSCNDDDDCCAGRCTAGVCEAGPAPTATPAPTPLPCVPRGGDCEFTGDCCSGSDCELTPVSRAPVCCAPLGGACDEVSNCCGTTTACEGICCQPVGSTCTDASECCGIGSGCVLSQCCVALGQSCLSDADCCAGSCSGGRCGEAVAGQTSQQPTPTPRPSPSPSPSPSPTPPIR